MMSPSCNIEEAARKCAITYSFNGKTSRKLSGDKYESAFLTPYHTPSAPSLLVMMNAFGEDMVYDWMEANVAIIAELAGNREKLKPLQIASIAASLISKFTGENHPSDRLNAAEVLLFFHKVVSGDFGTFYGAVDILTIGRWANDFLEWRYSEIGRVEQRQKREKEVEEARRMNEECVPPTKEQREILEKVRSMFKTTWTPPTSDTPELRAQHEKEFLSHLTEEQREEYLRNRQNNL